MPRRRPKNLDAIRYELGTYERQLAKDAIMITGIKSMALPLSAGLLGLGIAMGGFLAYNKIDDVKEWFEEGWESGFGAKADPKQIQEQVSSYAPPLDSPTVPQEFKGMSVAEMYRVRYDQRHDLAMYFSRLFIEQEGIPRIDLTYGDGSQIPSNLNAPKVDPHTFSGPNHKWFMDNIWAYGPLGTPPPHEYPTFRFERPEVIQIAGEDVNEISEYTYQMIIRETDSRNTQARYMSGLVGGLTTGIGAAASWATHAMLASSGFMANNDGWDGQNWEEANGANFDPLLMFAWARTDFQTGNWFTTADSVGSTHFWLAVNEGEMGGTNQIQAGFENPDQFGTQEKGTVWSYEQIIKYAWEEMQGEPRGGRYPFLEFLAAGMGRFAPRTDLKRSGEPIPWLMAPLTQKEIDEITREGIREQYEQTPEGDDHMPNEEPDPRNDPMNEEFWRARNTQPPPWFYDGTGPPEGWDPSQI